MKVMYWHFYPKRTVTLSRESADINFFLCISHIYIYVIGATDMGSNRGHLYIVSYI